MDGDSFTPESLQLILDNFAKENPEYESLTLELGSEREYYGPDKYPRIWIKATRHETDEEYEKRIKHESDARKLLEKAEKAQLEHLKKKYS